MTKRDPAPAGGYVFVAWIPDTESEPRGTIVSRSKWNSLFLIAILSAGLVFLASCSDDPVDPGGGDDPIDEELEAAETELEDALYEYLEPDAVDPESPDDVDFSGAEALYRTAYEADSSNTEARFGLAVTSLLILSVDPEVNEAFDEWEAYLDANTPFEITKSRGRHFGLSLGFPSGEGAFDLPYEIVTHTLMANVKSVLDVEDPQISRVQDIFRTVILPRAEEVIELLGPVVADPDFTYMVSPRMQGDPYEDAAEIDHTDVLALRAACELLAAGCHIVVAYDLQLPSYDGAGLLLGLDQATGNMARLCTLAGHGVDGAASMALVPTRFIAAVDDVDAAITSLLNETDPQDDDVIKTDPDDLSEGELLDFQAYELVNIRQGFAEDVVHTEDWDTDSWTPDVALAINLFDFFDTPPADMKLLLPTYAVSVDTTGHGDGYNVQDDGVIEGVAIEVADDLYELYYSVNIKYGVVHETDSWEYNEDFEAACDAFVESYLPTLHADPDWNGTAYLSFSCYESFTPGSYVIDIDWYGSVQYSESAVEVARITWADETFAGWVAAWPDPTVSGLLPAMSSGAEVCAVFGFEEHDWKHSFVIDWSDVDYAPVGPGGP